MSSATTEFCMYGMPWRKSTRVIGCHVDLSPLESKRCLHKPRGMCARTLQPHVVLSGSHNGQKLTLTAQPYPLGFCE
eukprot:14629611-Heterocapsa_arctica.AAC.1